MAVQPRVRPPGTSLLLERTRSLRVLLLAGCTFAGIGAYAQGQAGKDYYASGEAPAADPGSLGAQPPNIQRIFDLTNGDRSAEGLGVLAWSPALAAAAGAHAARMAAAASSELSHRYPGESDLAARAAEADAHFASIAENIAQGGGAEQIERAWMHSVPHRANILDPKMTAIGIAVVAAGGTLYAVEDFADARPMLTVEAVEAKVEAELRALPAASSARETPVLVDTSHRDVVRRLCAGGNNAELASVPDWRAPLTMSWQGSDLALPPALTALVQGGRYHAAAVGACPAVLGAFTAYRVTVVLN